MRKTTLHYAGTVGSFSQRAAKQFIQELGLDPSSIELVPCTDPPNTLQTWLENQSHYGVVPVWSNVLGPIPTARTKMQELGWPLPEDADPKWLPHFRALHKDKLINASVGLPIHFDLLAVPGVSKEAITRIASYSVAKIQCLRGMERELGERFAAIKMVEYPDSALAAKDLAALAKDPNATVSLVDVLDPSCTAVLALPTCAKEFGLEPVWAGVQDKPDGNVTHFVLFKK